MASYKWDFQSYRVFHDVLVGSHNLLSTSYDWFIVSHRFLFCSHDWLASSHWKSILDINIWSSIIKNFRKTIKNPWESLCEKKLVQTYQTIQRLQRSKRCSIVMSFNIAWISLSAAKFIQDKMCPNSKCLSGNVQGQDHKLYMSLLNIETLILTVNWRGFLVRVFRSWKMNIRKV